MEQHSIEWYKARLGKITGSCVSKIFAKSKKAGEKFGDTAKSYLYQVAAERTMNPKVLENEDVFKSYLEATDITNKAMEWGNTHEEYARKLYTKRKNKIYPGVKVEEVGSIPHKQMTGFASSPDGIVKLDDDPFNDGTLEIKCPSQATYMRYVTEITNNETLKQVKPEYYWQCMSHMAVTGTQWCDFVVYCPWQQNPMHIVTILRDEDEILTLLERIAEAEELIATITHEETNEAPPRDYRRHIEEEG